jgi:signal transduction histidine kinase
MTLSIRARLTLWYSIVLCGALVVSGYALLVAQAQIGLRGLDAELARISRAVGSVMSTELDEQLQAGDPLAVAAEYTQHGIALPGWTLLIASDSGRVIAGAGTLLRPEDVRDTEIGTWRAGDGEARTVAASVGECRIWRQSMEHRGYRFTVLVAAPMAPLARERAALREAAAILLPVALMIAALGGWWIGRRALDPLTSMATQATGISDRTPDAHLTISNPSDELAQLGGAFNALLDRLAHALHAQRQFMADASHQLRTPVSVIRTAAQVTLGRSGRAESEYRESLGIVAEQSARLTRMVDDMFLLARADANGRPLELADFYFDELIGDCVRAVRVMADPRQVGVETSGPTEVLFRGDEALLRQMLMNLLDNAVSHAPHGGRVSLSLGQQASSLVVAVTDNGIGILSSDRDRIFERFVRLDPSTKRAGVGGAGLGLPIARWIAEAHGGTLTLDTAPPVTGSENETRFIAHLPIDARVGTAAAAVNDLHGVDSGDPAGVAAAVERGI